MKPTIYDALRESHERQRSLCRLLLLSKAHSDQRQEVFTDLRVELAAHAAAEERFLYIPLMMEDQGLIPSRHALHEHHEIDEIIEDLRSRAPANRGWLNTARKLSHKVHHHLKEEESQFFQSSGKILSNTQKTALVTPYQRDYARLLKVFREE